VAWGWHGDSEPNGDRIYLYDIQNPSPPTTPVYPEAYRQMGGMISDGKIFAETYAEGVSNSWDVWYYNIESASNEWVDHSPWDQVAVAGNGSVVVYMDTEELGEYYYETSSRHIEIKDIVNGNARQVSILPGNFRLAAVSGHYLSFVRGSTVKELFVCDLLEGGFMDTDGHVCPLEGCLGPDAGPDAGK
jgi:hypothetical protein